MASVFIVCNRIVSKGLLAKEGLDSTAGRRMASAVLFVIHQVSTETSPGSLRTL